MIKSTRVVAFCIIFYCVHVPLLKAASRQSYYRPSPIITAQHDYENWIAPHNKIKVIDFYLGKGYTSDEAHNKYIEEAVKRFQKTLRETSPKFRFNFSQYLY
jgi:hypothetical protein